MTRIEHALAQPGIVAIVGPRGVGKTLMIETIARTLTAAGLPPMLLQAGQLPGPGGNSPHAVLPHAVLPHAVLIDDADRMQPEMLGALVRHGRRVVVAGSPALSDNLARAGLDALAVPLPLLTSTDARAFLDAQLASAGHPANLIDPAAAGRLFQAARGVPRTLQMLAGVAWFVARLANAPRITIAHVDQAILIRNGDVPAGETDAHPEASPDPQADEAAFDGGPSSPAGVMPTALHRPPDLREPPPQRRRAAYLMAAAAVMACIGLGLAMPGGWQALLRPALTFAASVAPSPPPAADIPTLPPVTVFVPPPAETAAAPPPPAPEAETRADLPALTVFRATSPRVATADPTPTLAPAEPPAAPAPPDPVVFRPSPPRTPDPVLPAAARAPSAPNLPADAPATSPDAHPWPMPPFQPVHVVLAYDPNDRQAERAAATLAGTLHDKGLDVASLDLGPMREAAGVYYYYPEDAEAASALAVQTSIPSVWQRAAYPPRPGVLRVVITSRVPVPAGARPPGRPAPFADPQHQQRLISP